MTTLQVFVSAAEVPELVERLVVPHGLRTLVYSGGSVSPLHLTSPAGELETPPPTRLFLVPPSDGWDGIGPPEPRQRGWVDVTPGRLVEVEDRRVLTLTTFLAENRRELPMKPATWLQRLRRGLHPTLSFGVRGRNVVHGGASEYRDIGYSEAARRLLEEGVVWKQYATDNSEFEPL